MALGRQRVELGDERDVALDPRLVQPLLADRPDAVVRQPGQVGVQDEAQGARHGERSPAAPWSESEVMEATMARAAAARQVALGLTAAGAGRPVRMCPPSPRSPLGPGLPVGNIGPQGQPDRAAGAGRRLQGWPDPRNHTEPTEEDVQP